MIDKLGNVPVSSIHIHIYDKCAKYCPKKDRTHWLGLLSRTEWSKNGILYTLYSTVYHMIQIFIPSSTLLSTTQCPMSGAQCWRISGYVFSCKFPASILWSRHFPGTSFCFDFSSFENQLRKHFPNYRKKLEINQSSVNSETEYKIVFCDLPVHNDSR